MTQTSSHRNMHIPSIWYIIRLQCTNGDNTTRTLCAICRQIQHAKNLEHTFWKIFLKCTEWWEKKLGQNLINACYNIPSHLTLKTLTLVNSMQIWFKVRIVYQPLFLKRRNRFYNQLHPHISPLYKYSLVILLLDLYVNFPWSFTKT